MTILISRLSYKQIKGWYSQIDDYFKYAISKVTYQSVTFWLIIALLVAIIACIFFIYGKIKLQTCISLPLFAFYISFVVTITIIARNTSLNIKYNLMPFWSYRAIFSGKTDLLLEVLWNIVLFIPIGILIMLLLTCKHKCLISIITGLLLSLFIEVIQLFFHRGLFEFDDIVHNTLGAFIGTYMYIFIFFMIKKKITPKNI